jgi:hypothetical protein
LSDKIYLDYYLADLIKEINLRILPLGGFKEVRRAYEYLWQPLNDPSYRMTGRVLCLVDTDAKMENLELRANSKVIDFRRIIYDEEMGEVVLLKVDDQRRSPSTEIEQTLDADTFLNVVDQLGDAIDSDAIKQIVKNSRDHNEKSSVFGRLDLRPSEAKQMMEEFFDVNDNKVKFARKYVEQSPEAMPSWISEIRQYFKPLARRGRRQAKSD